MDFYLIYPNIWSTVSFISFSTSWSFYDSLHVTSFKWICLFLISVTLDDDDDKDLSSLSSHDTVGTYIEKNEKMHHSWHFTLGPSSAEETGPSSS